ncbi:MAG: glycoside hydrolase family 95 protein [Verrucomicrobiota bacterium]
MKHSNLIAPTLGLAMALVCLAQPPISSAQRSGGGASSEAQWRLWYAKPASAWTEALPIGNGRLGAMVFGGVVNERIQFNEGTLWAGGPYDPSSPEALAALPEARKLIFEGKYKEADALIGKQMMARPLKQMMYQPVGDLKLSFPGHEMTNDYRRELDLDTAIVKVRYTVGGVNYSREVFASPVDQAIVIRLTADKPGQISFTTAMATPQKATVVTEGNDTLVMSGQNGDALGIAGALKFQARVRMLTQGGQITAANDSFTVTAADSATLLIVAATSYKNFKDVSGDPEALTKNYLATAARKPFDRLRRDHVAEHQRLFRRVSLDLGATEAGKLPTDQRIAKFSEGNDPQLAALYFQFGRYLLISCSRPGGQPATLQGLWNESMKPPWDSKYTININTEMNYWPAEPTGLGECTEPLIQMVGELVEPGGRTAKVNWGAGGWVCHHNTDLWRATAPIDGPTWGFWPMGGAWLCKHLWDRYDYGRDKQYLARAYPIMKGAAQFFLDTLVEEPGHKWLVTCPSLSPENTHPGGASVCAGPSMDMQIIRDLFSNCIQASEILGLDPEFRAKVAASRARLAPLQIGSAGQLQEWLEDWDMKAREIHHRHVSHLYALYPSDQITPRTPEFFAAAKKSLEIRGDGGTGWSLAWKINLWARLLDGDHAYKMITMLLRPGPTLPNMFDSCPPFQIDGNFGGASGITEMLLQSHSGEIQLLPALPKAWPAGKVTGLRARGNCSVDIEWNDGQVTTYRITSPEPHEVKVRVNGQVKTLTPVTL